MASRVPPPPPMVTLLAPLVSALVADPTTVEMEARIIGVTAAQFEAIVERLSTHPEVRVTGCGPKVSILKIGDGKKVRSTGSVDQFFTAPDGTTVRRSVIDVKGGSVARMVEKIRLCEPVDVTIVPPAPMSRFLVRFSAQRESVKEFKPWEMSECKNVRIKERISFMSDDGFRIDCTRVRSGDGTPDEVLAVAKPTYEIEVEADGRAPKDTITTRMLHFVVCVLFGVAVADCEIVVKR